MAQSLCVLMCQQRAIRMANYNAPDGAPVITSINWRGSLRGATPPGLPGGPRDARAWPGRPSRGWLAMAWRAKWPEEENPHSPERSENTFGSRMAVVCCC